MNFSLFTGTITQVLLLAIQLLNQASGVVPQKFQFWVLTTVGILQIALAILQHLSNPDGTSAKTHWYGGYRATKEIES